MKSLTYLIIDLGCVVIPFIASFYPKHAFRKEWRYFFPANIMVAIIFLIWDYYFTAAGIWGFNPDYLTGIYFFNLPLEEVLFFVCIPYACVFTYFSLLYLIKSNPLGPYQKYMSMVLLTVLFAAGMLNASKAYTSITFISTATYILLCMAMQKDLAYDYLSYMVILPFFFISNGILTGSIVKEPIVWYNNMENLRIRIGSIPIEDSIYGLLLILLNIHLYTFFKRRYQKSG